jgi:cyclic pyranopterin phosphate synthase
MSSTVHQEARSSTRALPRAQYPVVGGRVIAPRLEIGVVEHCNLRCRACSHVSPLIKQHTLDPSAVASDLEALSRHYHVGVALLMGGEPLLHPALIELIAVVRQSGVADEVWVVTNGRRLSRTDERFWQAIDGIKVSVYPGYAPNHEEKLQWQHLAAESATKLELLGVTEFRESYSELGASTDGLAKAIYESCMIVHKWRAHTLAGGRLYKCPQSYYLGRVIEPLANAAKADSIAIRDHPGFAEELRAYLEADRPLGACGHCLGTSGRRFRHAQVNRAEFRRLQTKPAEALVDYDRLDPQLTSRWQRQLGRIRRRTVALGERILRARPARLAG